MSTFKLGKMTLGGLFKKPETIQYPIQHRFAPEGRKGHIVVDIETCILCGICMKKCPTGAIEVDKKAGIWSIDHFRCIQCGYCHRECPKDCLTMDPALPTVAAQKHRETFEKPAKEAAAEA